jgi:hypothetical protein
MVRLATWMRILQADEQLQLFMGTAVGATTIRQRTEQAGQAQCPASPPGPEVQLMSVDGAFLQLVGGEWKEVKTLAVGGVGQPVEEDGEQVVPTHEFFSFSPMSDSKEDDEQALVEIHERAVEKAQTVCAVTDGAEWIQRFVDVHRPDAVRMLDVAHAEEKITEVGKTIEEQGVLCAFLEQKGEDKRAKRNKSCQTTKKQAAEPKKSNQTQQQLAAQQSKVR